MGAIVKGRLHGTGGTILPLTLDMFLDGTLFTEYAAIRIATTGTFSNCSRYNAEMLQLDNPALDDTFIFTLEHTYDEATWEQTNISGTLYHSLGANNISLLAVRNLIGSSLYTLSGICASSLVNRYAEHCPDGNSPYRLGDFRWYSHTTPGGVNARHSAPTTVDYNGSYNIRCYCSRIFKALTGQPYSRTVMRLYKGSTLLSQSSEFDLTSTFGAYMLYSSTNNYETTTNETFYIKTAHYNGSSWIESSTLDTFQISFTGNPYQVTFVSKSRIGDTFSLTYSSNAAVRNHNMRLVVSGTYGFTTEQINSGTPETIEGSGTGALQSSYHYILYLYDSTGWIQVLSGTLG